MAALAMAIGYENSSSGVSVRLPNNEVSNSDAQGDVISNFENAIGSTHNDFQGTDSGGKPEGRSGNDSPVQRKTISMMVAKAAILSILFAGTAALTINLEDGTAFGGRAEGYIY